MMQGVLGQAGDSGKPLVATSMFVCTSAAIGEVGALCYPKLKGSV